MQRLVDARAAYEAAVPRSTTRSCTRSPSASPAVIAEALDPDLYGNYVLADVVGPYRGTTILHDVEPENPSTYVRIDTDDSWTLIVRMSTG